MNAVEFLLRTQTWLDLLNWPLSSWIPFGVSLICLIMLIWMILQLTTRLTEDTDPAESDRQMLLSIHELHREGDLTTEEFRSLKGQLVQRIAGKPDRSEPAESAASENSDTVQVMENGRQISGSSQDSLEPAETLQKDTHCSPSDTDQ